MILFVLVQEQTPIANAPRKPHCGCEFVLLYMALFLVQPLVKDHLLEGGVQALLRHRSPFPAPDVYLGGLLQELNDRGEKMSAN